MTDIQDTNGNPLQVGQAYFATERASGDRHAVLIDCDGDVVHIDNRNGWYTSNPPDTHHTYTPAVEDKPKPLPEGTERVTFWSFWSEDWNNWELSHDERTVARHAKRGPVVKQTIVVPKEPESCVFDAGDSEVCDG